LFSYFTLQLLLRLVVSSSLDLDEAEQAVLSQKSSWGYSTSPPLYTWIQIFFFWVFGPSVVAISLLKNLLLLANCLLTYALAQKMSGSRWAGVAAALSLFFIPTVAWESQRDLSHTILSGTLALALLLALLLLHNRRNLGSYLFLGLCLGLGILSKYNFALWALGLLVAGVSLPEFRPVVLSKGMLLSLALAVVICLPHLLWILKYPELAFLDASKLEIQRSMSWLQTVALGLKHLVLALCSFAGPLVLIYLLLFLYPRARLGPLAVHQKLLIRAWLVIAVILMGLVLVARITRFSERWFEPILICLPVFATSVVHQQLTSWRLKLLVSLSLTVMFVVAVLMPSRLLLAERLKRDEPLTRPYGLLASQMRPLIPDGSLIVCNTRVLAGNLHLSLPQARAFSPELTPILRGRQTHCFLAWEPTLFSAPLSSTPPPALKNWAATCAGTNTDNLPPRFFSATCYFARNRQHALRLLQLY
jgi:4-amino-4-deoxy-L-arabinose transferase-like glycosyltransferase